MSYYNYTFLGLNILFFSYSAVDIQYDDKTEQVSLLFDQQFERDSKLKLEIEFQGTLNDHMSGFYRSSFKDKHGDTR